MGCPLLVESQSVREKRVAGALAFDEIDSHSQNVNPDFSVFPRDLKGAVRRSSDSAISLPELEGLTDLNNAKKRERFHSDG